MKCESRRRGGVVSRLVRLSVGGITHMFCSLCEFVTDQSGIGIKDQPGRSFA